MLLLPRETAINIQELIDKSRALQSFLSAGKVQRDGSFELCEPASEAPPVNVLEASNLFVITVSLAEALCGEEDVFGKLCEEACVTSTDRPFVVEGLIIRAIPLLLRTPLPNSKAFPMTQIHLRSRVASAYFEDERHRVASLISKAGLEQAVWCLGADAEGGSGVPIGVIARDGARTIFLDAWIARRERIDAPAKRYWQWRMMMRPWDVFLAQVLQFQCQLHDLFKKIPAPGGDDDPCGGARDAISEAATTIAELRQFYESTTQRFTNLQVNLEEAITFKGGVSRLATLNTKLLRVGAALAVAPQDRLLIRGGIVELPSAGYLPVTPGASLTINQQVRQMMGEGVDLRFCVVRPDYVAHALEEAQHMERISLLQGLDDPNNKPQVDILVPNGQILEQKRLSPGLGFEASVDLNSALFSSASRDRTAVIPNQSIRFNGAARADKLSSGGGAAYVSAEYVLSRVNVAAGRTDAATQPGGTINLGDAVRFESFDRATLAAAVVSNPRAGVWISLYCEQNVFELRRGDTTNFNARAMVGATTSTSLLLDVELNGVFEVTQETVKSGSAQNLKGHIENAQFSFLGLAFSNTGPRKTLLVDLDVTVTLTGGSAIEIVLTYQQSQFELSANWGKQPMEVKADIKTVSTNAAGQVQELILAEAALKENADVLSAKNASHILALDALEVIAEALGDINFADAKARLLFPPPPKPTDELIVRGTMDWVLFHRRRNKQCSEETPPPPPPVPSRHYQVYEILAAGLEDAQNLRKFLLAGQIPLNRLAPVAIVEFGGGVATLVTRPEDIQADWKKVNPGNTIVYGAIANRDSAAADGETLSRTRLDRLEDVLAPISKLDPQATDDFLNSVPASLPATGVDGVIVLITLNQIGTTCHLVYRINANQMNQVRTLVSDGNVAAAIANAQLVGEVNFNAKTADVPDNSLQTASSKWIQMGGGVPNSVLVTTSATDQTVPSAIAIAQSRVIQKAFGPAGVILPPPDYMPSPSAFPVGIKCPAISFVAPPITRTALVVFAQLSPAAPNVHIVAQGTVQTKVTFVGNAPQDIALAAALSGLPLSFPVTRIRGVRVAGVAGQPGDAPEERLNAAVKAVQTAGNTATLQQSIITIHPSDKITLGSKLDGIDEVIFYEF